MVSEKNRWAKTDLYPFRGRSTCCYIDVNVLNYLFHQWQSSAVLPPQILNGSLKELCLVPGLRLSVIQSLVFFIDFPLEP